MLDGWRQRLLLPAAVFLATAVVSAGFGIAWAREMHQPQVVLLGAGNRLSALVIGGDARLLIATGDDPVAFANALEQARRLTTRRLDILLVAGSGRDLLAPAVIRTDRHVRYAASLGALPQSSEAEAVTASGLAELPTPRRIRLGDGVNVTVERAAPVDAPEATPEVGWRAVIRRGATTVVILSHAAAAPDFPTIAALNALVVADDDAEAAVAAADATDAPVLVLAPGSPSSGKDLRHAASQSFDEERWAVRVHPGEAIRLRFVDGGLEVPREPAQPIGSTDPPTALPASADVTRASDARAGP